MSVLIKFPPINKEVHCLCQYSAVQVPLAGSMKSVAVLIHLSIGLILVAYSNAHQINGRAVIVYSTKENWFKASETCHKRGMQLLTINSAAENLEVVQLGNHFGLDSVWTAATDFGENRRWVWSTSGLDVAELYWRDGEPTDPKERCIEAAMNQYPSNWNDNDCRQKRPFICEEIVDSKENENPEVKGGLTLSEIFRRIG